MADYSVDQLFQKLERADAAGDTEAATVIADEIRRMQQAPKADFGGVSGQSSTVPAREEPGYWQQRGSELKSLGEGLRHNIAETALGVGQLVGAAGEDDVQAFRQRKAEAQAQAAAGSPRGADFFGGGDVLGTIATTAAPAARLGAVGGKAGLGLATAGGGAYGATRPVMGGESRAVNTGIGAAAGVGGQALGGLLGRMGQLAPKSKRDIFQAARDRDIPLTAAQMSDSGLVKRAALLSDQLPFSGATKRVDGQVRAVNREVARELGAEVNPEGFIDAGVMASRYAKFGDEFDRVFDSGMPLDREFLEGVASVWQKAEQLDEPAQRAVSILLRRLQEQGAAGALPGPTLKSIDRQLREAAVGGGDRQMVARELRDMLHDAYGRNAPAGAREAWDKLRHEYSVYKRIEPLIARNPEGPLPPTQLNQALVSDKMGKARAARGGYGDLGDLAMIGKRMQGPRTSGSAEGVQTAGIGYGMMANPGTTLGLLLSGNTAGRALNSHSLARLLMGEGRGKIAPLAPYARPLPLLLSRPAYADEPEGP